MRCDAVFAGPTWLCGGAVVPGAIVAPGCAGLYASGGGMPGRCGVVDAGGKPGSHGPPPRVARSGQPAGTIVVITQWFLPLGRS